MSKTNGHVAKFVLEPGKRDEALKILRPMFDQVEKEPGEDLGKGAWIEALGSVE